YDLVLTDWMMPEMDGLQLIGRIREHSQLSQMTPIMMVTGFDRETLQGEAGEVHVGEVLTKPVTSSTLLNAIYNTFGLQKEGKGPDRRRRRRDATTQEGTWPTEGVERQLLAGRRILVVEDNAINQEIAVRVLEGEGATVTLTGNGEEAVAAIEAATEDFDVVLMDLHMPIMDGYEATRRLRANPAFATLPILAMTANAMTQDRKLCLEAGMNDHVSKPINVERMLATLNSWMKPLEGEATAVTRRTTETGTTSGSLPPLPGLDVQAGLGPVNGDEGFYRLVLERFYGEHARDGEDMTTLLNQADFPHLERRAHTLKGLAATIGATDLSEACRALEIAAKSQDAPETIIPILKRVVTELAQIMATLATAFPEFDEASREETRETLPLSSRPAELPVDIATLTPLFQEIATRLAAFDANVEASVVAISGLIRGGGQGSRLAELKRLLKTYDFESAHSYVTAWAREMGISLEQDGG
ncbi:MAG: response regulator, partial [Alphaproteobacteria bacterium]